jgi:HK97 family phage portal protein
MAIFARAATKIFDQGVGTLAAGGHIWQLGWGTRSASGVNVTLDKALTLAAFWAGVRVLSESVAVLPLSVFRLGADDTRTPAKDVSLWPVLHGSPNPQMTSFVWREVSMMHLVTWGNAYSMIGRDGLGRVRELWPLSPDRMAVTRETGALVYRYTRLNGEVVELDPANLLHVPGLSWDGIVGYTALRYYREVIGLGLAAQEHGATFFHNGATSTFALTHPKTLSDPARKHLEDSVTSKHSGTENAWRPWILEEGMSLEQLTMPNDDAQWLETRKFQKADVATMLRLPPHMIGDLEHATFSNIEHQSLEFVVYSLMPWLVRWEEQIGLKLLGDSWTGAGGDLYVKFNVNALVRGDIKTRYESYAIGRQWGFLNGDKIAELEDWNPIPGGKDYMVPLNMTTVGPDGSITNTTMTTRKELEDPAPTAAIGPGALRCSKCDRLLAEEISPPYRLACGRCKTINEAAAPALVQVVEERSQVPSVHVEIHPSNVTMHPPGVTVSPPDVKVDAPVSIAEGAVHVTNNVRPPIVAPAQPAPPRKTRKTVERDVNGVVTGVLEVEV